MDFLSETTKPQIQRYSYSVPILFQLHVRPILSTAYFRFVQLECDVGIKNKSKFDLPIFQLLIERGANVNIRDKDGLSPSMWACRMDNIKHFQLLSQVITQKWYYFFSNAANSEPQPKYLL